MEFVFDKEKKLANSNKHGIDFFEAQALWDDPDLIEIPSRQTVLDEVRMLVVGKIAQKHWSAVITYRENDIRIISVRRSRKKEIAIYEENKSN